MEKLIKAKEWIEKLANGINPIDDTEIKDDDIVNNVQISRCLFYVADVIKEFQQKMNFQEEYGNMKQVKRKPHSQLFVNFEYSEEPISLTELVNMLNNYMDLNIYKKLSYSTIASWLTERCILMEVENELGKFRRVPTEVGERLGIYDIDCLSMYGHEYMKVVYNKAAQKYIVNHLDEIAKHKKKKKK